MRKEAILLLKTLLTEFLWPTQCILCKNKPESAISLCQSCKLELPWNNVACTQCANHIPEHSQTRCGKCLSTPPSYDHTFALFEFKAPITKLIQDFKFHEKLASAEIFGKLFIEKIQTDWYVNRPLPDVIIPMPLHIKRLRQRGYNQAVEIAKITAKTLQIKLDPFLCARVKDTSPQSNLSGKARLKNINKAFTCKKDQPYSHVAILDDVVTTGSTVADIAKLLKKKGIEQIDVWCCARTHISG